MDLVRHILSAEACVETNLYLEFTPAKSLLHTISMNEVIVDFRPQVQHSPRRHTASQDCWISC